MDQALAVNGVRAPYLKGTTTSINAGKTTIIAESKDGKGRYVNDIWTCYARVASCSLVTPTSYTEPGKPPKDPTYSIRLLMNPQGTGEIQEAVAALAAAAKFQPVTYGANVISLEERLFRPDIPKELKLGSPLNDGNMRYALDPVNDAIFQGLYYMNAKMYPATKSGTPKRPYILDELGNPVDLSANPDFIYPGCYVTVRIGLGVYKNESEGINATFDTVQFAGHGKRIISGFNPAAGAQAAAQSVEHPSFGQFVVPDAAPPAGYGQPQQPPPGYGAPPPGYGQPQQPPPGYGQPQPPPGYGQPPAQPQWQPPQGYPPQSQPQGQPQWQPPQPPPGYGQPPAGQWQAPPPAGPNGFAPPSQPPAGAALPPGQYPPPR